MTSAFCSGTLFLVYLLLPGAYGEMSPLGFILVPIGIIALVTGIIGVIWLTIRIIIKLESFTE